MESFNDWLTKEEAKDYTGWNRDHSFQYSERSSYGTSKEAGELYKRDKLQEYNNIRRKESERRQAALEEREMEKIREQQRHDQIEANNKYKEEFFRKKAEEKEYEERAREFKQRQRDKEKALEDKVNATGIPSFVFEPKTLGERRARANYWRQTNSFSTVVNKVTGKSHKFDILFNKFSKAQTEEEKEAIVREMEKMYPTTKKKIDAEMKKSAKGK